MIWLAIGVLGGLVIVAVLGVLYGLVLLMENDAGKCQD